MQSNVRMLFEEAPTARTEAQPSRFNEFWQYYPKKVGKPQAKALFDNIVRGGFKTRTLNKDSGTYTEIELEATAEEIIEGTKRYAKSLVDLNTFKRKVEDKYIPNPSTFLNQGRFFDE